VGGVDDELRDEVFFARLHAGAAGAAAALLAVGGDGRALEVAGVGDGDGDLLVGDEVFELSSADSSRIWCGGRRRTCRGCLRAP
jgi:hypothetical protein